MKVKSDNSHAITEHLMSGYDLVH